MPDPTPFGLRLKEVRERRGLSQTELDARSGVPAMMISHFETGTRPSASAATLVKLANALEVSIDYLLCRTDDPLPVGGRIEALLRSIGSTASQQTINTILTIGETLAAQDREKADRGSKPVEEDESKR